MLDCGQGDGEGQVEADAGKTTWKRTCARSGCFGPESLCRAAWGRAGG